MKTERMTMAQALVRFLDNQYINVDGEEIKFVQGVCGIFGHGNVVGLGEALESDQHSLRYYQGKNEQGMAHIALGFTKQKRRKQIQRRIYTMIATICMIVVCAVSFHGIRSVASNGENQLKFKYYTQVTVAYGETLWDLSDSYIDYEEYKDMSSVEVANLVKSRIQTKMDELIKEHA